MVNAVWVQVGDTGPQTTERIQKGNFSIIYLQLGEIQKDTSLIKHYNSDREIQLAVDHWKGLGYSVYGWVLAHKNYGGGINLSEKEKLVGAVVADVKNFGFDGFKSDLEVWGDWENYIQLLNLWTDAMHGLGKKHHVDIIVYYPDGMGVNLFKTLRCDLLIPMFYDGLEFTVEMKKERFDFICSISHLPMLMGITSQGPNNLKDEISWMTQKINQHSAANIQGVALWWVPQMDAQEWQAWYDWGLKDGFGVAGGPVIEDPVIPPAPQTGNTAFLVIPIALAVAMEMLKKK